MKIHPMRVLVETLNKKCVNNISNTRPLYRYCNEIEMIQELKNVPYCATKSYDNMGKIEGNSIIVKNQEFGNLIEQTLKDLNMEFIVELR